MPEPDDHYYVTGSSPEDDPQVDANGVLINSLGITNTADLAEAEAEIVLYTTAALWEDPVRGRFDLPHLQEIHLRLFLAVYPWAGELRGATTGKGDTMFLAFQDISTVASTLFQELQDEQLLQGLEQAVFCERAGEYLGRLNMIHPFREGNGRTQREFFAQLAKQSGFVLSWEGYAPLTMTQACVAARDGDYRPLTRILKASIKDLPAP